MKNSSQPETTLFGMQFSAVSLPDAAKMIVELASKRAPELIVTPNVDHIVSMSSDLEMREIFQRAKYRFADGMPIVWLSRLLRRPLPERVTGADLLIKVSELSAKSNKRIFLLGGLPGVAEKASTNLINQFPGLIISGTYCPPFGFEKDPIETGKIISIINSSNTDILFVGVGAPKQEKWASHNIEKLAVGPILGVGAAFDFAAGTLKRAPKKIQSLGLEWLWRLCSEPRRLWKRYLIKDSIFLLLALKEIINSRTKPL